MSSIKPQPIALLGSTGSIGCNTLDVIASLPGEFEVVALAAGANVARLWDQAERFRPRLLVVRHEKAAHDLRQRMAGGSYRPEILSGPEGLRTAATSCGARIVVAAVVGVVALEAIEAALQAGCRVALANKEALVAAGELLRAAATSGGGTIIPIDSEHSAIHQCLRAGAKSELGRLILTASGGPFRTLSAAELAGVSPEQALRHPTWSMGNRVTLDSATLMNKGFEILEACHLFGVEEAQVEVLIHPQSIVHSMVEFQDGSIIAQLGTADMRTPIQYALSYPHRLRSPRLQLKLEEVGKLEFYLPDTDRFPCLRLAREAGRAGQGAGAVLNAADEVALEAFVGGRVEFCTIAVIVEAVLQRMGAPAAPDMKAVLELDGRARAVAWEEVEKGAGSVRGSRAVRG